MRRETVRSDSVLVTGASSGIGRAIAVELADRGYRVYGSVRRDEHGEEIRRASGGRVVPVRLDVTDADSIASLHERLERELPDGLGVLINNAGIALAGPLELISIDAFRHQLDVNVTGQLAVTQAMISLLRTAGGRIIMMSSVGGRSAVPFIGPYCASKSALEAATDALRVELAPWGIDVVLIEPASIKTPIWTKSEEQSEDAFAGKEELIERLYGERVERVRKIGRMQDARGAAPETVVRVVIRAMTARRPRTRYLVGGASARLRAGMRFLPDRVRDRIYRALFG